MNTLKLCTTGIKALVEGSFKWAVNWISSLTIQSHPHPTKKRKERVKKGKTQNPLEKIRTNIPTKKILKETPSGVS